MSNPNSANKLGSKEPEFPKEDIWRPDSLSSFDGLIWKGYEKLVKQAAARVVEGKMVKGGQYYVYRCKFTPWENYSITLLTELFQSDFEKLRACKIKEPDADIKISVEGSGKGRILIFTSVFSPLGASSDS